MKSLKEWLWRVFNIKSDTRDDKEPRTYFVDAYRLFDKGEYSACIVSACSELEYLISLRHTDPSAKDYGSVHQIFRLSQYLKNHSEGDVQDAYKLMELRNKIVHQKYAATETDAQDFLHFAESVIEDEHKT